MWLNGDPDGRCEEDKDGKSDETSSTSEQQLKEGPQLPTKPEMTRDGKRGEEEERERGENNY